MSITADRKTGSIIFFTEISELDFPAIFKTS